MSRNSIVDVSTITTTKFREDPGFVGLVKEIECLSDSEKTEAIVHLAIDNQLLRVMLNQNIAPKT